MGNHACDRVLRFGVILALLAALAGCSGRSTNPDDHQTEPTIHDPFENEEAELLALIMSGELCAPRDLYEQVDSNLATIRARWGDSIPELLTITYRPFWSPSYLSLGADGDAVDDMENGTYTAWDSLNEYYHLDRVIISHSGFDNHRYVALSFTPRLDPRRLTEAYAGLPGIGYIQPAVPLGDWSCVYGGLHDSTATYLFRHAWGDCPAGCTANEFWYFRAYSDSVEYVGRWAPQDGTPHPVWWDEASTNWENYRGDDILWERTDSYIPTAVTDLRAEDPGSNDVTLAWTAPADSSYTPRVGSYLIAYASTPITEETWKGAHHVDGPPPSLPGVQESFRVTGLTSDTHFYFAIKSRGSDASESPISNTVRTATLPAIGWSTFESTGGSLPGNTVTTLTADRSGGVWAATSHGIAHYDGQNWHAYASAASGMDNGSITGIAVDPTGNAWCTTYKGVHRFDGSNWTLFDCYNIGLPDLPLCVGSDPAGNIWSGSARFGVARNDNSGWSVVQPPVDSVNYDGLTSLTFGPDGDVWFGSLGHGVFRWNSSEWTTYTTQNSGIATNSARSVAMTSDGVLWVAHDIFFTGVSRFDGTTWTVFDYNNSPLPYRVGFVVVDASDREWFPTAGAARYDGTSFSVCKPTNSGLVSENVKCITQDAQGNMWFGTDAGVSRLAADYIEAYLGPANEGGL